MLALNGDELVDVDFDGLLERHRASGALATVTVAQPPSQFGQVDLTDDDVVTGFHEVSRVPYWVNCGIYALSRRRSSASRRREITRRRSSRNSRPRALCAGSGTRPVADGEHAERAAARRRARDAHPDWLA